MKLEMAQQKIFIETSYKCNFEINKSKSGYIVKINRTNKILKL